MGNAWTSSAGTLAMTIGLVNAGTSFGVATCVIVWIAFGVVGEGEGEGEDRESGAAGTTGDRERGGCRY